FLTSFGSMTPEARAVAAGRALRLAVEHPAVDSVQVKQVGGDVALLAAGVELFRMGPRDAELAHAPSLREHASEVAENLTETIQAENKRRKIATTISAESLAALLAVLALLLMPKTSELAQRAHASLANH